MKFNSTKQKLVRNIKARYKLSLCKIKPLKKIVIKNVRLTIANLWNKLYWLKYKSTIWQKQKRKWLVFFILCILCCITYCTYPYLDNFFNSYFEENEITPIREALLSLGGALVGATVLVFSFITFSMQVNIERLPSSLFNKLNRDKFLLGAFIITFILAIILIFLSVALDKTHITKEILAAIWIISLIFLIFIYAYQRSISLINPSKQLNYISIRISNEIEGWLKRFERAGVFFENDTTNPLDKDLDIKRSIYFRINNHWTIEIKRAISYCIAISRKYIEYGDFEVSAQSSNTIININRLYVKAKGKTFFANNMWVDNPYVTDGVINETLEHLRRTIQIGITKKDERQIEQTLTTFAGLVTIYLQIEYPGINPSKTHANLAAAYLLNELENIIPLNMPNVLTTVIRDISIFSPYFLRVGKPNEIVLITDKIGSIALLGMAKKNDLPVTLAAVEYLTNITFELINLKNTDVDYAINEIRKQISLIAQVYIATSSNNAIENLFGGYLKPYYSGILISRLTESVNALLESPADKDNASIIKNINDWSKDLYRTEKELLLLAIIKKSPFAQDIINFISQVITLLLAILNAPACQNSLKRDIEKNASNLACVFSWLPTDINTVKYLESYKITETLFEIAVEAYNRESSLVFKYAQEQLLNWGFNAGKNMTGWGILEQAIYGLTTLSLLPDAEVNPDNLKTKIRTQIQKVEFPDSEMKARTARDIRETADTLRRQDYGFNTIENYMTKVDQTQLRALLREIADLLAPNQS